LVDFIGHVSPGVVERLGAKPGTMNLVDEEAMRAVLACLDRCDTVPGGSCANTIRGIAWLRGGREDPATAYSGAIGDDDLGRSYERELDACGVRPLLARKQARTGVSVILVTPDHERTMFTHLGACREYGPKDLPADLEGADLLYITGYLWDTEPQKAAGRQAVERARRRGRTVALDVADPFVVDRNREDFLSWIPGRVDILFANRRELAMLTGSPVPDGLATTDRGGAGDTAAADEATLRAASGLSPTIVMKAGSSGSLYLDHGRLGRSPAAPAVVVDTTGAGDAFAAGYLYGHLAGMDPEAACALANRVAAGVVSVEGCRYRAVAPVA
jgi:sugar/nucleoside kinase (ribokinase family)